MKIPLGLAVCGHAAAGLLWSAGASAAPMALPVRVEAAPAAHYLAKCHVRSFKSANGLYANTYYIDSHGPFRDTIPSPNAQCVFAKTSGPGRVILHILKNGDHSAASDAPGRWVRLEVW